MDAKDPQTINSAMTIRRMDLADKDREAVARLAERDSQLELDGPVLGIEVEGRLLAALSLASGAIVADPFSRTTELRALLELRAAQFRRRRVARRGGWLHARRRRAPLALGGSPAGQVTTLARLG